MRSLLIKLVPRAALPFAERNPYLTLRQLPSKQQARAALPPPPAPAAPCRFAACSGLRAPAARTERRRLRAQPPPRTAR